MSRQAWRLRIGEQVAGYRIERVLGRGGTASVYQGTRDGRSYAVKVMHAHDRSGVGRKRFEREAAFVQRLVHPNVVEIFDYGFTDTGRPFIVFEELEGVSLKEALRRDGAFEPLRAVHIVTGVLDALDAAHLLGIIHRDIKPGNIFLVEEEGGARVKVLDFGLAKAFGPQPIDTTTLTKTGFRIGTPRYMSPEMARGRDSEPASDLYALGLVFAEMLAGEPVIVGDSQMQIMLAHSEDDALRLPAAVQQSPFAAVIRRAVEKDLARRYTSARQMRDAVGEVVEGLLGDQPRLASTAEGGSNPFLEEDEEETRQGGGTIVMKHTGRLTFDLSGFFDEPTKDKTTAVIRRGQRARPEETVTILRRTPSKGGEVADPATVDTTTSVYRPSRPLPSIPSSMPVMVDPSAEPVAAPAPTPAPAPAPAPAPPLAPRTMSHRAALVVGLVLALMTFLLGMALLR